MQGAVYQIPGTSVWQNARSRVELSHSCHWGVYESLPRPAITWCRNHTIAVDSSSSTVVIAAYDSGSPFMIRLSSFRQLSMSICAKRTVLQLILHTGFVSGGALNSTHSLSPSSNQRGDFLHGGRCYHAHWGGILIRWETSSWGRRHPHSGGPDYNAIIFPPGRILPGGDKLL